MMIDRRTFVVGTALVAVTPALPPFPRAVASPVPDVAGPLLMIHGWSVQADGSPDDQLWLMVGHGWRTAWR
jgi:hypothetical protein